VATNNSEQIKSATDGLNKVWGEVAQELYAQQGAQQGPEQGEPGAQKPGGAEDEPQAEKKEDVQDASYEVVDDDDKDK
jgi:molecular chaperone DnaK